MYQSPLIIVVHGFWAKAFNIHRFATDEVFDASFDLRRASRVVRTIVGCFSFNALQLCSTFRAMRNELHRHHVGCSLSLINSNDFRNDFPSLFHIDHITDMEIKLMDDVCIV